MLTTGRAAAPILLAVFLFVFQAPDSAQAQMAGASAGAEVVFQNFSFSDEADAGLSSVSLLTLPFAGRIPLGPGARVELRGAFARGELTRPDDSTTEISGLTDTEVRLVGELADGAVTAQAFALIPTGSASFSNDQLALAGIVGADLLPFRISNWGSGGGFGAAVSLVRPMGDYGVGVSAGYTATREFEPLTDQTVQYRPGNQMQLRAAIDRTFNGNAKGTVQLAFQSYSDDQVDGENLFRSGNRIQATGSYAFPAGASAGAIVYAGYLHRAQGTFLTDLETRSAQGMALLGGGLRTPMMGGVLAPSADLRLVRRSDGTDQGILFGAGATLELPAGDLTLLPSARVRLGTVTVREDVESGFSGIEIGFGARFGG